MMADDSIHHLSRVLFHGCTTSKICCPPSRSPQQNKNQLRYRVLVVAARGMEHLCFHTKGKIHALLLHRHSSWCPRLDAANRLILLPGFVRGGPILANSAQMDRFNHPKISYRYPVHHLKWAQPKTIFGMVSPMPIIIYESMASMVSSASEEDRGIL